MASGGNAAPVVRSFPGEPASLPRVRAFVREEAGRASIPVATRDDLLLAVSEACTNAVLHSGSAWVEVTWTVSAGRVDVTVKDGGIFDRTVSSALGDHVGGFGIPFMMALMDRVTIRHGSSDSPGTLVVLSKRRTANRHPMGVG